MVEDGTILSAEYRLPFFAKTDPPCSAVFLRWLSYLFSFRCNCQQQASRGLCSRACRVVVRPCLVRSSVNIYSTWREISVFSGGILMNLVTNNQHVSGNCWKMKRFSRSKAKGQGHSETVDQIHCCGGGIHFDVATFGVASRITRFVMSIECFIIAQTVTTGSTLNSAG